jgi:hypothetical protein
MITVDKKEVQFIAVQEAVDLLDDFGGMRVTKNHMDVIRPGWHGLVD